MHELKSYFDNALTHALRKNHYTFDPLIKAYIIELLCHNIKTDVIKDETIVSLLQHALDVPAPLKFNAYRRMGDITLFISSVFLRHVEATGGITYYVNMGSAAYDNAYSLSKNDLMLQLSKEFAKIVCVVNDMSLITDELTLDQAIELYMISPSFISSSKLTKFKCFPMVSRGLS